MKAKWEKMVARHWYPLGWSAFSHGQKDGLRYGDLYWSVNEYLAIRFGNPLITDFCVTENFIDTNFLELVKSKNEDIDKSLSDMEAVVERVLTTSPGQSTDIKHIYEEFKLASTIMVMAFYLGPICQEKLKSVLGEEVFAAYQSDFSKPSKPTLWAREHSAIGTLKKRIKDELLTSDVIRAEAQNIANEFGFIHSDLRAKEWIVEDYIHELERIAGEDVDEKEKFETSDEYTKWLIDIIGRTAYIFDEGKCALIKASWALRKTLEKIGLDETEIMACSEEEFYKWIETGKLPEGDLQEREKYHAIYSHNKEYVEFFGKDRVEEIIKREGITEFDNFVSEVSEFKGQIAFKGKVQGIVRRTYSEKDANALLPGEILVASMTQPELMRGMMNAAAFITDEGGLLCHAAIIARELKKPCIIGTKIATKVLKDGDLVEVDAEKGVVRILKRV